MAERVGVDSPRVVTQPSVEASNPLSKSKIGQLRVDREVARQILELQDPKEIVARVKYFGQQAVPSAWTYRGLAYALANDSDLVMLTACDVVRRIAMRQRSDRRCLQVLGEGLLGNPERPGVILLLDLIVELDTCRYVPAAEAVCLLPHWKSLSEESWQRVGTILSASAVTTRDVILGLVHVEREIAHSCESSPAFQIGTSAETDGRGKAIAFMLKLRGIGELVARIEYGRAQGDYGELRSGSEQMQRGVVTALENILFNTPDHRELTLRRLFDLLLDSSAEIKLQILSLLNKNLTRREIGRYIGYFGFLLQQDQDSEVVAQALTIVTRARSSGRILVPLIRRKLENKDAEIFPEYQTTEVKIAAHAALAMFDPNFANESIAKLQSYLVEGDSKNSFQAAFSLLKLVGRSMIDRDDRREILASLVSFSAALMSRPEDRMPEVYRLSSALRRFSLAEAPRGR